MPDHNALFNDGVAVLVDFVDMQLVQQALLHERAGVILSVYPVALTRHIVVNAAADVGHVRALGKVVAHHSCSFNHLQTVVEGWEATRRTCVSCSPNENVVSKVAGDLPRRSFVGNQALS